jgi:hypothetical protein
VTVTPYSKPVLIKDRVVIMKKAAIVLAFTLGSLISIGARADQLEMQAAALLAFNAASMCHVHEGLYRNTVEAHTDGHSDQTIKDASQVAPGSEADKVISQALTDSKSGKANAQSFYDTSMKAVKERVYSLLQQGKTT